MSLSDTRRNARAIKERWPVGGEYRIAIIRQMMQVLLNPNSSNREKTAAARALITAEGQNQVDEVNRTSPHALNTDSVATL